MFRHAESHRVAGRGNITDAISIRERPALVEDRALPGHWEGDLLIGSSNSGIAGPIREILQIHLLIL
jgi:IS30 family transposase